MVMDKMSSLAALPIWCRVLPSPPAHLLWHTYCSFLLCEEAKKSHQSQHESAQQTNKCEAALTLGTLLLLSHAQENPNEWLPACKPTGFTSPVVSVACPFSCLMLIWMGSCPVLSPNYKVKYLRPNVFRKSNSLTCRGDYTFQEAATQSNLFCYGNIQPCNHVLWLQKSWPTSLHDTVQHRMYSEVFLKKQVISFTSNTYSLRLQRTFFLTYQFWNYSCWHRERKGDLDIILLTVVRVGDEGKSQESESR